MNFIDYHNRLDDIIVSASVDDEFSKAIAVIEKATGSGKKLVFIGNGGSAAIASHLANDFVKNGGMRAIALNDSAALTCLANDFGYEQVFSKQIEMLCDKRDVLVAISSSGKSRNILSAVAAAKDLKMPVITLSGFDCENPLRGTGDVNFYVPSDVYGFVEIAHLTIGHAILDVMTGAVRQ